MCFSRRCFMPLVVAGLVPAFALVAQATVITQYSFENDLTDSAAGGATADDLTDGDGLAGYVAGVPGIPGGQAASIDGNAGVVTAADSDDLDMAGGDFSIDLFVNPTSYNGHWNRAILKWESGFAYHLALRGTEARVDLFVNGGANVIAQVGPALTLGEWHHIAISNDASEADGLNTYVDGVLVATSAGVTLNDTGDILVLGNSLAHFGVGLGYVGLMDEVRFHDVAVDQAYVTERDALRVPEPTSLVLVALAGLGLVAGRRRRRN